MAQAQTPREKIDIELAKMWPGIQLRMEEFLAEKGRYFQGIRTPIVIPADGTDTNIDKTLKPTDQEETWEVFDIHGNLPNQLPCSIELHIHVGPSGVGYTFYGWMTDAEGTWIRAQGSGTDSQTFPWTMRP